MGKRLPRAALADLRQKIAQESARLMMDHGINDYRLAKRKAAEKLAVSSLGALPSNQQIDSCLAERQRLFEPESHVEQIRHLRQLALDIMRRLAMFEPRLVGSVLSGTVTVSTTIELHVFAASAELVASVLENHAISASTCERRQRFGGGRTTLIPGFRFKLASERIVALVFPEHGVREAPLSSVDRRPMMRASIRRVEELLDD